VTIRVLCLDIEGGYGGSSRSLYESIRHLPAGVDVEVWCRRDGPILKRYEAIGVPCRVMPDMPHIGALPRLSRNLYAFAMFFRRWSASTKFRRDLASALNSRFDVVHCNHEGLFLLARWLRRTLKSEMRLTAHVRTRLPSTLFSRWQYRTLHRAADRLVFITEMERDNVAHLTGRDVGKDVIYNIVETNKSQAPDPNLAADPRFKIASMSNYAWLRGNDRLVELAVALADLDRRDILFVVGGNMALSGSLPGVLGQLARSGGTLADYAAARGVSDMFNFLGHVPEPSPILAACQVLARPSRNDDPWGREVLEALALGLPVLAVGQYDRFVETGTTGALFPHYDAARMARSIIDLAENPTAVEEMSVAARLRVADYCDGRARAEDLANVWRSTVLRTVG